MARRPRLRFAAPLVIVTACGQAPPAALPVDPPPELGMATTSPIDAAVDAPVDAAVDAPVDAAARTGPRTGHITIRIPARRVQPGGYVSCHDFGPTNRGCNPPRPYSVPAEDVDGDMISMQPAAGGGFRIVVHVRLPEDVVVGEYRVVAPAAVANRSTRRLRELRRDTYTIEIDGGLDREGVVAGGLVIELVPGRP